MVGSFWPLFIKFPTVYLAEYPAFLLIGHPAAFAGIGQIPDLDITKNLIIPPEIRCNPSNHGRYFAVLRGAKLI